MESDRREDGGSTEAGKVGNRERGGGMISKVGGRRKETRRREIQGDGKVTRRKRSGRQKVAGRRKLREEEGSW